MTIAVVYGMTVAEELVMTQGLFEKAPGQVVVMVYGHIEMVEITLIRG
jgi:hypothetical protein